MDFKKLLTPLVLALAAASFALPVVAQWQWIEKDGRKVFSDRPPPADVQEKSILRRPGGATRAASPEVVAASPIGAASAPASKASAPKLITRDTELEAKKKKAEEEAAEKKKADEASVAKAKAENCERARGAMATLQSGVRMSSINTKGEREVFDDARRAAETRRAQEAIDSNCK
ncbi:MAG: DUF4124 domain-containing protein [Pseudomonadota bacterium]